MNLGNKYAQKRTLETYSWAQNWLFIQDELYQLGTSKNRSKAIAVKLITLIRPTLFKNKLKTGTQIRPHGNVYPIHGIFSAQQRYTELFILHILLLYNKEGKGLYLVVNIATFLNFPCCTALGISSFG